MRFILFMVAIVGCVQLRAQSFSDSIYMDVGIEMARTQLVVCDKADSNAQTTKFVAVVDEWETPVDKNTFESKFSRPFSWIGRQFFMRVGYASSPYTLFVNGKEVGRVQNSTSPAEFNITRVTKEGRNSVTIKFDSGEVSPIEGWGKVSSAPTIKEACVVTQPTQMIRDLKIKSSVMSEKLSSQIYLIIKSHALADRTSTVHYSLRQQNGDLVSFGKRDITQSMRGEDTISFNVTTPLSEGWSGENPHLYSLQLSIQHEGRFLEYQNYLVGFRVIDTDPVSGELLINNRVTKLIAKRVSSESLDIKGLKSEGFNAIKIEAGTSAGDLYEACDREGIYVIATSPINSSSSSQQTTLGGNPSNDPAWWGAYMQRIDANFHAAQIHPSVVAFGVADNSLNGYNLYEGYLRLKQKAGSAPVIYFEADGEWNSDKLDVTLK